MLASEIVRRAYRLAGIVAAGEATPNEFAIEGLDTLNEMLDGWVADGLDVGLADLVQGDDIADTSLHYCLRYNLAVLYCEENGRQASPFVTAEAIRTKGALQVWEGTNELEYDNALTYAGSTRGVGYDITSDT